MDMRRWNLAWGDERVKSLDHELRALKPNEGVSRGAEGQQAGEGRPMHRESVWKAFSLMESVRYVRRVRNLKTISTAAQDGVSIETYSLCQA